MNNTTETNRPPSDPAPASHAEAHPARRVPSMRMTAVLAASMLAIGVVVGAAIGPAPTPSLALSRLLPLLVGARGEPASAAIKPPPSTATATPTAAEGHHRRHKRRRGAASSKASTPTATATTPISRTPNSHRTGQTKTVKLPALSKVWLIELGGSSFAEVAAHPSAAPYITTTAGPTGTLLSGYSALQASALANDAALIAGPSPQLLDTIVQPPCPEGNAGASCTPDTPAAVTAADEFLKATLPTITSQAAYRENGLVVVTFASITAPTASGLPVGAASAALTSQPPAGALLISPFLAAGAKSSATFDPTAPKQSLEKLLRR